MTLQDQIEEAQHFRFQELQRRGYKYSEAHELVFGKSVAVPQKEPCKYPFGGPRWPGKAKPENLDPPV